jgi:hypothetical protein
MITPVKIKSIRSVGKRKTMDIQVSKNNLFFANGILTHNSGFNTVSPGMENISESIGLGAPADVMCSLWQEEEERQLGVMNMGMQKNRFGPNFGSACFKVNYETLTIAETNSDFFEDDPNTILNDANTALAQLAI